MNKKLFGLLSGIVLVLAVSTTPFVASADTGTSTATAVNAIQAQIAALLKQVSALRDQIVQIAGTSTHEMMMESTSSEPGIINTSTPPGDMNRGFCLNLGRNLTEGSRGDDVSNLQKILAEDPSVYPQNAVTGYFGTSTAQAVIRLQKKYGIASTSIGFVGPITRNFFQSNCLIIDPMEVRPNQSNTIMMHSSTMMDSSTRPLPPIDAAHRIQHPPMMDGGPMLAGSSSVSSTPPPPQPTKNYYGY